jgi:branched-chain amino acid aminotransferase
MIIFVNDQFIDSLTNCVSANDRGLLLGDGLFETIRAYQGKTLFLKQHWERLLKGVALLEIPVMFNLDKIENVILELLTKNHLTLQDARIRLTLTRGHKLNGLLPLETPEPTLIITVASYKSDSNINNIIVSTIKRNEFSPLSNIKSLNYLDNILALQEAKRNVADEALLFNTRDHLACATTANVFMVKDNTLYTPPLKDGALPGIMRNQIFILAEALKIKIEESSINLEQLKTTDEIFLTNSLVGVRPVSCFYGKGLSQTLTIMFKQCLDEYITNLI